MNELYDLFKNMSTAKGNRGILNHRRFISRIRAGNALFNNDEHHDSHEFLSWLIDEIHMNIHEDYRFFLRKKLQSKEYAKELNSNSYQNMGTEQINDLIAKKILPNFKTWVQLMFEG